MFNTTNNSTIYKNYLDSIFYNLNRHIKKLEFENIKYRVRIINNIKFYFNLLTLKSNYILNKCVLHETKNLTSYYSIFIPLKFNFYNLGEFIVNYNILNIPKIGQTGDIILNGYNRVSSLYLYTTVKYVDFLLGGRNICKYIIYLKYNFYINIYFYKNDISISINKKIFNINFFTFKYNNIYSLYNLVDIFYIFNIFKNNKKNLTKFNIFNFIIYINKFLYEAFYIEFIFIIFKLINIEFNRKLNIDNSELINKSVNSVVDSLLPIIKRCVNFSRFLYSFNYLLNRKSKSDKYKFVNTPLFRENFIINPKIHYTNQVNILAYFSNRYKMNIFGYSDSSSNKFSAPRALRNVQYDYLTLINMLYTVDGKSCGLTATIPHLTIKNKLKLEIYVHNNKKFKDILYFSTSSKNLSKIVFNKFISIKKSNIFKYNIVEILENNEFKLFKIYKNLLNFYISESNFLSITELVIPFLLHNDPCRGLMGSKMHTQALPLIYSSNPYIFTKYNEFNSLLFFKCIISLYNGVVVDSTNYKIVILDHKNRFVYYYLNFFNLYDYISYTKYKPIVWPGEKVVIGQPLAVPYDFNNLEFTLGFNNLVNYNFYYGHEHEDAIIINKNLLFLDILTSISFDIYDDSLSIDKSNYIELTSRRLVKYRRYNRYPKNKLGILSTKEYIFQNTILLLKVKYKLLKYRYKHKKLKIFMNKFLKITRKRKTKKKRKKLVLLKKYISIKKGGEGRLVKFNITSYNVMKQLRESLKTYLYIQFFVAKINRIKIGDKLCGRHGNKGIISKIIESVDMPYTSFDVCPYIITSPIGALARINFGQFLEGVCGNLGFNSNLRLKSPIHFDNSYMYSYLYLSSLSNFLYKNTDVIFNFLFKTILRDFKTGYKSKNFTYFILLYYFKLMHTAKSKFQYRTLGDYSNITQQPVQGRSREGGQKFGEMEVWSLEAHGTSYNLKEMTLLKTNYKVFKSNKTSSFLCSESFKTLVLELKSILLNIKINKKYNFIPTIANDIC